MEIDRNLIIKVRRDLHKIPEASLKEYKTIKYIEVFLKERNIDFNYVTQTGIIAFINGKENKTLGIRADIDALEITENTNLDFSSLHDGFMHACGHDFHMTNLLLIADYYSKNIPPLNLILIFQPAEEGAGGAKLMIKSGLYDYYGKPDFIFGYHVKPDLETGIISAALGTAWAGTLSFRISFIGHGGHGANPHKSQDLVMVFSQWYSYIQGFISRKLDAQDSVVLTIGSISGASRLNIIPSKLQAEGMLRYFDENTRDFLINQIKESLGCFTRLYGAGFEFTIIRDAIPLFNDIDLLLSIERYYNFDLDIKYLPKLAREQPVMLAEDFPEYLKDIRGIFFFLGAQNKRPQQLHVPDLNLNEDAIFYGINFMNNLIENFKNWI